MRSGFAGLALATMLALAPAARATVIDFESQPDTSAGPVTISTSDGDVTFDGGQVARDLTNAPADETAVYWTSYFSGGEGTMTITFANDINNFFMDLYNGQTYNETYTISDNAGRSTTVTIAPNTSSGTSLVSFPAVGNVVTITTDDSHFDFFIDKVGFNQETPTTGAPEPGTWALMFVGVGLAGAALRRRRATVAAAA